VTRRPGGALMTLRRLCALIVRREGKFILLDAETACLLEADVSTLNDGMWRKIVDLGEVLHARRYVVEIGKGREQVRGYTQLGIIEAISVVGPQWQGKRLAALLQLIGKAFAKAEAEWEAAGRPCRCRCACVRAVHSQRVGADHAAPRFTVASSIKGSPSTEAHCDNFGKVTVW
jgi:hypothetical protein